MSPADWRRLSHGASTKPAPRWVMRKLDEATGAITPPVAPLKGDGMSRLLLTMPAEQRTSWVALATWGGARFAQALSREQLIDLEHR